MPRDMPYTGFRFPERAFSRPRRQIYCSCFALVVCAHRTRLVRFTAAAASSQHDDEDRHCAVSVHCRRTAPEM